MESSNLVTAGIYLFVVMGTIIIFFTMQPLIVKYQSEKITKENNKKTGDNNYTSEQTVIDGAFSMHVEDVFSITGRGTVVTGKVESGTIKVGDEVEISNGTNILKTKVSGIEMLSRSTQIAQTGDNIGLLLSSVNKTQIQRGDTIYAHK